MKELSIEEKARAYDEAIKYAHYLINERCKENTDGSFHRADLNKMFSELAESEDERIRKYMIKYFEANKDELSEGFRWNGITVEKCIAWLEKQGKNNMGISEATKQKLEDNLNKALEKETPESCNEFLEKQGEQKTADKVEPKFKVGDTMRTLQEAKDGWTDGMPFVVSIDSEYYNCNSEKIAIEDQDEYEFPPMNRKQKPTKWSEEDETKIKSIIVLLKSPTLCAMEGNKGIIAANIKYLNSLKERIGNFDDGYKAGFSAAKYNQWKPSDEQLRELENVFSPDTDSWDEDILRGLYEQIKKL